MPTQHWIVGAGPAGLNAIETIRALDASAAIGLVCDEPAYSRMVLPYYLEGKVQERAVMTGDDAWFQRLGVETVFGRRVASVDAGARQLRLDDGSARGFDRLLLATGSRASRPDLEGVAGPGVVDMWTLDDARRFLAEPHSEVVVVGAGFIAFTVLDALVARAGRVRFLEIEPQILPRMLDRSAAELVAAHLAERGIEIRTESRLERVEEVGGRRRLHLADGSAIECDVAVMATGIRTNTDFLRGSGIRVGGEPGDGVIVDGHLCSTAAGIYAAGDVAQGPDLLTGQQRVHAIQPTAVDHGRVAGANMAGMDVDYAGSLTMNILAVQGLEACSFGQWQGAGHEVTAIENAPDRVYRKYVWDEDRIVGGILVGPTLAVTGVNDVGMLKGLVQTGVRLGPWRAYLEENPLDLRRPYVASGAARALLESTLLTGRASAGGGFRFPSLPALRRRSSHHATLLTGAG
jgi:NAD(P)H-nitrite reductase large subunit